MPPLNTHPSVAGPGAGPELLSWEEMRGREGPPTLSHPEVLGHQCGTHKDERIRVPG